MKIIVSVMFFALLLMWCNQPTSRKNSFVYTDDPVANWKDTNYIRYYIDDSVLVEEYKQTLHNVLQAQKLSSQKPLSKQETKEYFKLANIHPEEMDDVTRKRFNTLEKQKLLFDLTLEKNSKEVLLLKEELEEKQNQLKKEYWLRKEKR